MIAITIILTSLKSAITSAGEGMYGLCCCLEEDGLGEVRRGAGGGCCGLSVGERPWGLGIGEGVPGAGGGCCGLLVGKRRWGLGLGEEVSAAGGDCCGLCVGERCWGLGLGEGDRDAGDGDRSGVFGGGAPTGFLDSIPFPRSKLGDGRVSTELAGDAGGVAGCLLPCCLPGEPLGVCVSGLRCFPAEGVLNGLGL